MNKAEITDMVKMAEGQVMEARLDLDGGEIIKAETHLIIIQMNIAEARLAAQDATLDNLTKIDETLTQEEQVTGEKASDKQADDNNEGSEKDNVGDKARPAHCDPSGR